MSRGGENRRTTSLNGIAIRRSSHNVMVPVRKHGDKGRTEESSARGRTFLLFRRFRFLVKCFDSRWYARWIAVLRIAAAVIDTTVLALRVHAPWINKYRACVRGQRDRILLNFILRIARRARYGTTFTCMYSRDAVNGDLQCGKGRGRMYPGYNPRTRGWITPR